MDINATLIAQMIAFLGFVWLTKAYVWPPVLQAMQAREQKIADGLAAGQAGERQLAAATDQVAVLLKEAREQAAEILNRAHRRGVEAVEEAKAQARAESERLVAAARGEIQQEIGRARETLRREVATLAVAGAARILGREIDAGVHAELLDQVAQQLN